VPFTSTLRSLKVAFSRPRLDWGPLGRGVQRYVGGGRTVHWCGVPLDLDRRDSLTPTTVGLFEPASSQSTHLSRVEEEKDLKTVGSGSVDHQTAVKASWNAQSESTII